MTNLHSASDSKLDDGSRWHLLMHNGRLQVAGFTPSRKIVQKLEFDITIHSNILHIQGLD